MERFIKIMMATAAGLEQAYLVYNMMQAPAPKSQPQRRQIGFASANNMPVVAKKSNSEDF